MKLRDIIAQKKAWRAHTARVKALPRDYQIVYGEMQKYLFRLGPVDFTEGRRMLSGIVDLFEEGAVAGKDVLAVTGRDVAAFCDALTQDTQTYADIAEETADSVIVKSMHKLPQKQT